MKNTDNNNNKKNLQRVEMGQAFEESRRECTAHLAQCDQRASGRYYHEQRVHMIIRLCNVSQQVILGVFNVLKLIMLGLCNAANYKPGDMIRNLIFMNYFKI